MFSKWRARLYLRCASRVVPLVCKSEPSDVLTVGREAALALTKMALTLADDQRATTLQIQVDTSYGIHQDHVAVGRRWRSPPRVYSCYYHGLATFLSFSLES